MTLMPTAVVPFRRTWSAACLARTSHTLAHALRSHLSAWRLAASVDDPTVPLTDLIPQALGWAEREAGVVLWLDAIGTDRRRRGTPAWPTERAVDAVGQGFGTFGTPLRAGVQACRRFRCVPQRTLAGSLQHYLAMYVTVSDGWGVHE
ncbi:hypothetical protein Plo01_63930 [Planobispora longispora]|uniref:Uncharacterized protein n=1 Tax=Planobispora longispora TaxID=28887 RepID=A0A8J3RRN6_9ACTN|nr:hypothetical protein GCM10020093_017120 [Planobispora longispora]GIH79964.1 hypothetical protein Plo01_63930 [Planobispora longispora]